MQMLDSIGRNKQQLAKQQAKQHQNPYILRKDQDEEEDYVVQYVTYLVKCLEQLAAKDTQSAKFEGIIGISESVVGSYCAERSNGNGGVAPDFIVRVLREQRWLKRQNGTGSIGGGSSVGGSYAQVAARAVDSGFAGSVEGVDNGINDACGSGGIGAGVCGRGAVERRSGSPGLVKDLGRGKHYEKNRRKRENKKRRQQKETFWLDVGDGLREYGTAGVGNKYYRVTEGGRKVFVENQSVIAAAVATADKSVDVVPEWRRGARSVSDVDGALGRDDAGYWRRRKEIARDGVVHKPRGKSTWPRKTAEQRSKQKENVRNKYRDMEKENCELRAALDSINGEALYACDSGVLEDLPPGIRDAVEKSAMERLQRKAALKIGGWNSNVESGLSLSSQSLKSYFSNAFSIASLE